MLIMTRRVGETINIGNDITATVLGVKGNQVRIGVNAPPEVSVDREEVRERKNSGMPDRGKSGQTNTQREQKQHA